MQRKGQAALEFLTTYGWAFLLIMIMIGALAYFGILNPTNLLPDRCQFGAEIECVDYIIDEVPGSAADNDLMKFRLKNNVGETITVTAINFTDTNGARIDSCTTASPLTSWRSGETRSFDYTACELTGAGYSEGAKEKILVEVIYYEVKSSATYTHIVNGEVFSSIQ